MSQAEERLVEVNFAANLRAQAEDWQTAKNLRRYCEAMDVAYSDHPESAEWLA